MDVLSVVEMFLDAIEGTALRPPTTYAKVRFYLIICRTVLIRIFWRIDILIACCPSLLFGHPPYAALWLLEQ